VAGVEHHPHTTAAVQYVRGRGRGAPVRRPARGLQWGSRVGLLHRMSWKRPAQALRCIGLLTKTVKLIQHYHKLNPNVRYYIENPMGRMQYEPVLQELPRMI
jgi:hypothetical protein